MHLLRGDVREGRGDLLRVEVGVRVNHRFSVHHGESISEKLEVARTIYAYPPLFFKKKMPFRSEGGGRGLTINTTSSLHLPFYIFISFYYKKEGYPPIFPPKIQKGVAFICKGAFYGGLFFKKSFSLIQIDMIHLLLDKTGAPACKDSSITLLSS